MLILDKCLKISYNKIKMKGDKLMEIIVKAEFLDSANLLSQGGCTNCENCPCRSNDV